MSLLGLCSILTGEVSILPLPSGSFWILWTLCNPFLKRAFLLTMPAVNVSLSILRKKKQTAEPTILYRSSSSLFLNILRASTIPDALMAHLACLLLIRLNFCSPSMPRLCLTYFSHSSVHFFDYGPILLFFTNYIPVFVIYDEFLTGGCPIKGGGVAESGQLTPPAFLPCHCTISLYTSLIVVSPSRSSVSTVNPNTFSKKSTATIVLSFNLILGSLSV